MEEIKELVLRIQQGSNEGFKDLYQLYVRRIFNFVFRLTERREEAEDITQDVFLIVYNRIQELKEPERFDSWLYRIARNEVYQRIRKKRGGELSIDDQDTGMENTLVSERRDSDPLEVILQTELGAEIKRSLRSLPFKMKEVFILSVIEEKSYEEITRIVGRSLLSVKTDIYRARLIAKETLKEYVAKKN